MTRSMHRRTVGVLALSLFLLPMQKAHAWVAVHGWCGGGAIYCHPAPYYPGVGAAAVAGFATGAALAAAARPAVYVQPQAYYGAAPMYGTIITTLPYGSQSLAVNGVQYYQYGSTWYRPYFGYNGVYYQVVSPP